MNCRPATVSNKAANDIHVSVVPSLQAGGSPWEWVGADASREGEALEAVCRFINEYRRDSNAAVVDGRAYDARQAHPPLALRKP